MGVEVGATAERRLPFAWQQALLDRWRHTPLLLGVDLAPMGLPIPQGCRSFVHPTERVSHARLPDGPSMDLATGHGFPNVVVTGIAMTTSVAPNVDDTWKALLDGRSGIRRLDDPFVGQYELPVSIGGSLYRNFCV